MSKSNLHTCFLLLCSAFFVLQMSSCIKYKHLVNYNQGPPFPTDTVDVQPPPDFVVQTDDILQIQVSSTDMRAAAPFNPFMQETGNMMQGGRQGPSPLEYLVDGNGYIYFPTIGKVEVQGKTTTEITDTLNQLLQPSLNDAVVKVRVLNFRVVVKGEVRNPGPVTVPEESLTILEALGMAGDMTDFANRENILVIRELAGKRSYKRLNLLTTEVFESDYFYLQQGDVIYVEPLPQKSGILSNEARVALTVVGTATSVVSLILSVIAVVR